MARPADHRKPRGMHFIGGALESAHLIGAVDYANDINAAPSHGLWSCEGTKRSSVSNKTRL